MAIVVVGIGGRLGGESARPSGAASAAPEAVATPATPSAGPVVALSEPAPPPAALTGIPLWVRGRAATTVHEVVLVLRSGDREVARQSVQPSRSGRFAAVFTLQPPRPAMDLTVVAIARDDREATLGEVERTARVAPLDRVAAAPTPRPLLGEDGVLGSRGVDITAAAGGSSSGPVDVTSQGGPWPRPGGLAAQTYR